MKLGFFINVEKPPVILVLRILPAVSQCTNTAGSVMQTTDLVYLSYDSKENTKPSQINSKTKVGNRKVLLSTRLVLLPFVSKNKHLIYTI